MRLTYFDDAGVFSYHEPNIVVGGVILNADRDMIPVEKRLQELAIKHIPEEDRKRGFVFHAQDLWHGGPYFVRDKWSLEKRLEILADLVAIPATYDLNLTFGFQARENMSYYDREGLTDKQLEIAAHSLAVARFCESVEEFMRLFASDEVTLLIAEDRDTVRRSLKAAHATFRDELRMKEYNPELLYFPFWHIRDTIHFAKKTESAHLQIADVCTFIVKRRLIKCQHIDPFWQAIKPQLLKLPEDEPQEA